MPGLAGKGWRKRSYALKTLCVRFLENTNFIDILSGFVYKSAVIVVSPDFSFRERSARQKFGSETLRLWAFFVQAHTPAAAKGSPVAPACKQSTFSQS